MIDYVTGLFSIFQSLSSSLKMKLNLFSLTKKTWLHSLGFCWPQLLLPCPSFDLSHTGLLGLLNILPTRESPIQPLCTCCFSAAFFQYLGDLLPHNHGLLFYFSPSPLLSSHILDVWFTACYPQIKFELPKGRNFCLNCSLIFYTP